MAMPRQPFQALVILLLATWFLRSSLAQPVLALPSPPPPPDTLCIPRERDALLEFKAGLVDPDNYLSLWRGEECCRWIGVECSNRTGHVVKLELDGSNIIDGPMEGEINPSLLTLRHLRHLDLSFNDFGGKPIPEFIGGLRNLTHLLLSGSYFGGRIPPHLGNLSNLLILDLSNQLHGCYSPDLAWLSQLWKLKYLGMSQVDLSAVVNWAHVVNMLPSLVFLELQSCGLRSTMPPPLNSNLTSLENLYLDSNSFNSSVGANYLAWDLPVLKILSMYSCGVQGLIPAAVGNLTYIQSLVLDNNNFFGKVPSTFKKLKKLQVLRLSNNLISGGIEDLLLHRLPTDELQELHLQHNRLAGRIPARLEQFSSLSTLRLNDNKLFGEVPVGIRDLTNLKELRLNSNNLHGTITEHHFTNLTRLEVLWLSNNSLTILVDNTWNTPFKLTSASFRSCILGPKFPTWIGQTTLGTLDISNTSIQDSIPDEFWNAVSHAKILDLSENRIVGRLPTFSLFGRLGASLLDISSNQLVGPIPTLPKSLLYLDLSGNNLSGELLSDIGAPELQVLMLFKNSFSGAIPCSLFELEQLKSLDLSENQLNGTLLDCPNAPETSNVFMLSLNNNNITGEFPSFLQRFKELKFLDLAYNQFSGSLPAWIGSKLPYLAFMRLRSNMFSGGIPVEVTGMKGLQYLDIASNNISGDIPLSLGNLVAMAHTPNQQDALFQIVHFRLASTYMFIDPSDMDSLVVVTKGQQLEYTTGIAYMVNIDLSCNRLTGKIPQEIGMLVALTNLNLSWNHLSGMIPQTIGELRAVESFDLSHNELSGEIPTSLASLTSLTHLNLSYNNLTGTIPSGNQLRTLDDQPSIYVGNPGLCGPPVSRNCSGNEITPQAPEEQHEGMSDVLSFYLGIDTGLIAGLWMVFCGFLFKRNWRIRWFSFSDSVYDWVYLRVALSRASLARKKTVGAG
ncbi:receptor-like protein EIX2 [Hordeum vulgare subsp. vulgare]|uniref:Leucine-rich repeat-containing N-terminal plant-type domain-containing protein n=1 Tax=Hordeum vulgare subsp. vulgare TaxID=112509 RepID=A0A8I6Y7L7_HORVV|nr:receptor-like protein EIX2 [Hordeum vulgare subsp. vulgare]